MIEECRYRYRDSTDSGSRTDLQLRVRFQETGIVEKQISISRRVIARARFFQAIFPPLLFRKNGRTKGEIAIARFATML